MLNSNELYVEINKRWQIELRMVRILEFRSQTRAYIILYEALLEEEKCIRVAITFHTGSPCTYVYVRTNVITEYY